MFRLVRKGDEQEDSNFPPTLHAAMELFGRVEMMSQALTCKKHVDAFLKILETGPGTESVSMGASNTCVGMMLPTLYCVGDRTGHGVGLHGCDVRMLPTYLYCVPYTVPHIIIALLT